MTNRMKFRQFKITNKRNQKKGIDKRMIPMYFDTDYNRNVVTPNFLPYVYHPNKIIVNIMSKEHKDLLEEIKNDDRDYQCIVNFIKNDNEDDTSIIKVNNKFYEWESGKEIIEFIDLSGQFSISKIQYEKINN